MIALIVLAALVAAAGLVIGAVALIVAIVKTIIRTVRGPRLHATRSHVQSHEEGEFQRIISAEWP